MTSSFVSLKASKSLNTYIELEPLPQDLTAVSVETTLPPVRIDSFTDSESLVGYGAVGLLIGIIAAVQCIKSKSLQKTR